MGDSHLHPRLPPVLVEEIREQRVEGEDSGLLLSQRTKQNVKHKASHGGGDLTCLFSAAALNGSSQRKLRLPVDHQHEKKQTLQSSKHWITPGLCTFPPPLSLYTNCCTSSHQSVKLIKFADDTTLIGLISNGDETAYRREVARLVSWCGHNNLQLNAQKTVEMIMDFRKATAPLPPLALMDSPITITDSFRFLGATITRDLKWEPTISSLIKKAQQRMFFLRKLRKLKLPPRMLAQFYTAIIESILTSSITVWFAGATVRDRLRLQRVVRAAEKVIGCRLPSIQDLYISRTRRQETTSIRTRTSRYTNSFFPSAIRLLNTK
ncbi:hypothetical protein D4764_10G0008020 [Takifugu flavidus]|uniref:Alkylated DNA repair protein AlkB homologue 8 N-terminal domain-containing protein n=1 Tax=Takifugu flavidus TaxID=433684 RepID=A0A5C6PIX6_9TELE|nr:hypothetical protein D4764_10G0008020 [Takifugu flavidus]